MKTIVILATIVLASCALPTIGDSNPLDVPGASQPTAEELHAANIRAITGNPVHPE